MVHRVTIVWCNCIYQLTLTEKLIPALGHAPTMVRL